MENISAECKVKGGAKVNVAMLQKTEPLGLLNISGDCTGCGNCRSVCHTGAIQCNTEQQYWINAEVCVSCGHCIASCEVGAISDISMIPRIRKALADPRMVVVVKEAPSIRPVLEQLYQVPAESVPGKLFTAFRQLGFDKVYSSEFNAELTVMEEGTELIHRLFKAFGISGFNDAGPLPQLTSWCPAWNKQVVDKYSQMAANISGAKSPQQMFGKLAKSYTANKLNVNPRDMFVVSVVSCIAKKYECLNAETRSGISEVDAVITTTELIEMMKNAKIDFASLPEGKADQLMATASGEEILFGLTTGIMEAAIKVTYELLSGQELPCVEFTPVPGIKGVKEAKLEIPVKQLGKKMEINICMISGLKNAAPIIEEVVAGNSKYHFIEVIGCPGGCINGGGQPLIHDGNTVRPLDLC